MKNFYQILEVSETASHDEIKKQYRFLSQAWHPDKFPAPEQKKKAEEKIKDINEAYSILGNPVKRKEYDKKLNTEKSSYSQPKSSDEKKPNSISHKKSFSTIWVLIGIVSILAFTILGGSILFNQLQSSNINAAATITSSITFTSTNDILPTNTELVVETLTPKVVDSDNQLEDMIFVESGTFIMGRNDGAVSESPEHTVYLDNYYIDKYEVTNFSYNSCVIKGICQPPTRSDIFSNSSYFGTTEFETYPVVYVSWEMANLFCQWRNARLPTEAEWEKAARGINSQVYPWGNEFLENRSNFCDQNCPNDWANQSFNDGYASTSPVGAFPLGQSSYGVFDMVGNVYEWVNDWYLENYYSQSPQNNPAGPESGQDHVIRGGAWGDVLATSAISRASFSPTTSHEFIGFRCARSTNE